MEVTINTVNQNIVTFSSEFGTGMAEWHVEIPKINSKYNVEFEIEELLYMFCRHISWKRKLSQRQVADVFNKLKLRNKKHTLHFRFFLNFGYTDFKKIAGDSSL